MPFLTIGMPTYRDFDGVYFTIQALRLYQDVSDCEFIIIDNFGCTETESFSKWFSGIRYIRDTSNNGTAYAKNLVFKNATSPYVLCMDCHILLFPGVIRYLIDYYKKHPTSRDLLQGPMYYDDFANIATHMDPVWRGQMFGTWGYDPRVRSGSDGFEIPLHGMGLFSSSREGWPGFNPHFRGFGGEEGYIHEKYRQAGRKCLCLPPLAWIHRFGRPQGVPYPLKMEDKVKNYFLGHYELGQDVGEIYNHFQEFMDRPRLQHWENDCRQLIGLPPIEVEAAKAG